MLTMVGLIIILSIFGIAHLVGRAKKRHTTETPVVQPMRAPRAPFGIFIDSAHSWLRMMSDGSLRVGIDDLLADSVGTIEGVDVPAPGTKVERGETLMTLRVGKRQISIPAPISGEVVAHNDAAQSSPVTMTSDPYGLGWVLSLRTADHKEAFKPLHVGNGAIAFLKTEFSRLADFFTSAGNSPVPVMADGGVPQRGAVAELDDAQLEKFQDAFLKQ